MFCLQLVCTVKGNVVFLGYVTDHQSAVQANQSNGCLLRNSQTVILWLLPAQIEEVGEAHLSNRAVNMSNALYMNNRHYL